MNWEDYFPAPAPPQAAPQAAAPQPAADDIVVGGPDGATVRFPAGTDQQVILRTMQQRYQPQPNGASPPGFGDVHDQRPLPGQSEQNRVTQDFFPSLGTGLAQGAYELATLPATLLQGAGWLGNQFEGLVNGQPASNDYGAMQPVFDLQQQGRGWLGDNLHQPTTTTGEFARTVGEFIPGAVALGPGQGIRGAVGNAARYGVVPGLMSEAAGQATEGTGFEPYARIAAGILGTGVMAIGANAGAGAGLPGNVGASSAVLARYLRGTGMTQAEAQAAERLVQQGTQAGVPVTWPEALFTATNGRIDATALQRFVEQSRGGQPVMSDFISNRTQGATAAAGRAATTIGPASNPAQLGQLTQELADDAIRYVRDQINIATEPLYRAAGPTTVDPVAFGRLFNDPLVQRAIPEIRASPVYGRTVAGMPDDSVAMMDALKKYFDDLSAKAAGERTQFASSVYGSQATAARDAATAASPDYADALLNQSILRRDYLAPLEGGPLGAVRDTNDIGAQLQALFPQNPFSGSASEVTTAVRALSQQNPQAAGALVRQHVEQVFNQATRNLTRGENTFGAARFVAEIKGNPQQAANLEAGIRALPNGDTIWDGYNSLLRVLQATGSRLPAGSPTTFNTALEAQMSRGTPIATLGSLMASPMDATSAVGRWYRDFRLGKNSRQLAEIITDPASLPLLQRLALGGPIQDLQRIAGTLLSQGVSTMEGQEFGGARLGALVPQSPRTNVAPN